MLKNLKALSSKLNAGGIAVIPTDTIYGIVARALDKKAVERLYKVRQRNPKKPCIILISAISYLKKFGITFDFLTLRLLDLLWPGPVSIVLPL